MAVLSYEVILSDVKHNGIQDIRIAQGAKNRKQALALLGLQQAEVVSSSAGGRFNRKHRGRVRDGKMDKKQSAHRKEEKTIKRKGGKPLADERDQSNHNPGWAIRQQRHGTRALILL